MNGIRQVEYSTGTVLVSISYYAEEREREEKEMPY